MTPKETQQNEAIAKELGWTHTEKCSDLNCDSSCVIWRKPNGLVSNLPNFLEQINIAIAEDQGWEPHESSESKPMEGGGIFTEVYRFKNKYTGERSYDRPNFCNDLNAMREAWLTLKRSQRLEFSNRLRTVIVYNAAYGFKEDNDCDCENATAPQRAIAYCRTKKIGPWKE